MAGPEHHFLEIPIYRVRERVFNAASERALSELEREVFHGRDAPDDLRSALRDNHFRTYGGPWRYNQAVGWLRLLVLGTQIRGDLWMSDKQRLTRKGARDFRWSPGHYFFVQCNRRQTSVEIMQAVRDELADFQRDYRGGRLFVDLECFDELSPHIDWAGLVFGRPPS